MATQKIHFFTGKGGVGKSTLAAAFAYELSQSLTDSNILLTELSESSFYKDFFNLPLIQYQPTAVPSIEKNLKISQWSPTGCLKEYALHLLKIESLYKLFFENPVSKSLIQVAPGLQELAILGKATSSVRKHGPEMNFDQIVIDSYSTGHFINLLNAPKAMSEVIQFGPMGEQSRSIAQWIKNSEFCFIHIVCLPEILPTTETIELYQNCQKQFGITPKVYLNKFHQLTTDDLVELSPEQRSLWQEKLNAQEKSIQMLTENKISFQNIPFVPQTQSLELIQQIALHYKLGQKQ